MSGCLLAVWHGRADAAGQLGMPDCAWSCGVVACSCFISCWAPAVRCCGVLLLHLMLGPGCPVWVQGASLQSPAGTARPAAAGRSARRAAGSRHHQPPAAACPERGGAGPPAAAGRAGAGGVAARCQAAGVGGQEPAGSWWVQVAQVRSGEGGGRGSNGTAITAGEGYQRQLLSPGTVPAWPFNRSRWLGCRLAGAGFLLLKAHAQQGRRERLLVAAARQHHEVRLAARHLLVWRREALLAGRARRVLALRDARRLHACMHTWWEQSVGRRLVFEFQVRVCPSLVQGALAVGSCVCCEPWRSWRRAPSIRHCMCAARGDATSCV